MGQAHSDGSHFGDAKVREQFALLQTLWSEEDLSGLLSRLKEMTLNFSLDRAKFTRLLQLPASREELVAQWFRDFSHDRASQVVDGLEFLSAALLLSSQLSLQAKLGLLFELFDLDRTGCIRREEFTIFLKASTTGLHRAATGLPAPAPVSELGGVSAEFFATVGQPALTRKLFFAWVTEAHYALHYLSVLSRLGTTVFAWGANRRRQLGLSFEPEVQRVPAPLLALEGVKVAMVASSESHCLFLAETGQVWSCGLGFCGILGHGGVEDCPAPRPIEALQHAKVTAVAAGVRHSAAVSDKGQVFTWGSADLGQLGHGPMEDREVHEWAADPRSGGSFAYVSKPTVIMGLFGQRVVAKRVACCSFSTAILTDQGRIFTWGNNTDGQCGQGQKCPDHQLVYVDPHMQRTAMQALFRPRPLEVEVSFRALACGGYHMVAVDKESRVWSWGQGMWGKLGHGDQRSMYEPKLLHALRYQVCLEVAAGEAHSLALCALYRLTITGNGGHFAAPLAPFSLLGLPIGRVDRDVAARRTASPPNCKLEFNAFACSKLLRLGLPFHYDPEVPIPRPQETPVAECVVLMDRGLWDGEWLKLSTSDFDFRLRMSPSGAALTVRKPLTGPLLVTGEGRWEDTDLAGRVCVFEDLSEKEGATAEELKPLVLDIARRCSEARAMACLCVLPKGMELFAVEAPADWRTIVQRLPFGVLSFEHGAGLREHVSELLQAAAGAGSPAPEGFQDWRECREVFTGRLYYENTQTGERRHAPPQVQPDAQACLVLLREEEFLSRLKGVLDLKPRGVVVSQQSWRPDVELLELPEAMLEELSVPIVQVTYEAGEELKSVCAGDSEPWVSMELQPYGGVCAWGSGSLGQLGLAGIENRDFLTRTQNVLTGEDSSFASKPCYVAHLHEHQVVDLACGASHTVAVTQQGEVFAWGSADGLGVPLDKPSSEVPVFVEQLEGLAKATKAFAGQNHSFVVAEMPHKSVV